MFLIKSPIKRCVTYLQAYLPKVLLTAPINSRLNVVVRSPTQFGLGRNGCWPSRSFQLPWALPFIFSLCCPLNDRSRAAHGFFKIVCLFSLFFLLLPFSCPSSSPYSSSSRDELQRSSQTWLHLSLLSVRWKCDLAGQVSAMLHLLQMGPSTVLTTFSLQIQSS